MAANTEAARHFYRNLISAAGQPAVSYLKRRGLSGDVVQRFGLGYATGGWQDLLDHLRRQGFSDTDLEQTGLFGRNKRGGLYDLFRDRLMFPIIDTMGRILAFGGRVLDDSLPKYINSPETPVYSKGKLLYALNLAGRSHSKTIILVEGYMDVIALHQAGFDSAVAVLGTALTEDQARLLKRYADKVIVSFDADAAGKNAALRSFDILERQHCPIHVLAIPDGQDPDEYIRSKGADRFKALLQTADNLLDYRFKAAEEAAMAGGFFDADRFMQAVTPVLLDIDKPTTFDRYVDMTAARLGNVRVDSVRREIAQQRRQYERSGARRRLAYTEPQRLGEPGGQDRKPEPAPADALVKTSVSQEELTLFTIMARLGETGVKADGTPALEEFSDARTSGFPGQVLALSETGRLTESSLLNLAAAYEWQGAVLKDKLAGILMRLPDDYPAEAIRSDAKRLARQIQLDYLQGRRNYLNGQLDHGELAPAEKAACEQERNEIALKIKDLRRSKD